MTRNELRELLDEFAKDAPPIDAELNPALFRGISRRRRMRGVAVTLLSVATVTILTAGIAVVSDFDRGATVGQSTADTPRVPAECGEQMRPPPNEGTPLRLRADMPAELARDQNDTAVVTATLHNTGQSNVEGIAAQQPRAVLVRNGIVASGELALNSSAKVVKLGPGESQEFRMRINLRGCADEGGRAQSLGAGEYQVYAEIFFQFRETNGTAVGEQIYIHGGPWLTSLR